jgi:hypothetical protein
MPTKVREIDQERLAEERREIDQERRRIYRLALEAEKALEASADVLLVEDIKVGEFVRIRWGNPRWSTQVYRRAAFCRINKRYQLDSQRDISKCQFVKKGTELLVNFTY